MYSLLFPGQGSQVVGMCSELYDNFNSVKEIFKKADDKLKIPISKIILNGPEDQLKLTEITQPAILTVSYSFFKTLKDEFNFNFKDIKFFAGHSLGEYSALVCSEALNFEDAISLVNERGKAMQNAVPVGKGRMLAVLGANIEEIKNLLDKQKKDVCEIANDNANGQVIISGNTESINKFEVTLKEKKLKSIPLKVSAPFHCSMMKPAANIMKKKISETNFKKPLFKIVSNVKAQPESDPNIIKELLIEQIYSTVRWRESLISISQQGIQNFIEIGPGKVLTGMVKRTIKNANCFSINSIADIKNLNDKFKK